jgi:hypothetical protein
MRWLPLMTLLAACGGDEGPVGVNEVGPGFLEVFSTDAAPVSLAGWSVATDSGASWAFPGVSIEPDGLLLVGLDGRDADLDGELVLPEGGGLLTVLDADGAVLQEISVPALTAGRSYGRIPDGIANWQIIEDPSPGALNAP